MSDSVRKRGKTTSMAKPNSFKPTKLTAKKRQLDNQPEDGPRGWFLEQIESTYTRLAPPGASVPPPAATPASGVAFASKLQPGEGESVLTQAPLTSWQAYLAEYKRRKASVVPAGMGVSGPTAAIVPGARNWLPLGPTIVLNGQTIGNEPVGGRISGLVVVAGGQLLYAASACGGVFRSDDGGTSWRSLMDGFDVDPNSFASASLTCGAIAIDQADPRRIYVGTGEGDTHQIFRLRIVNALPAYRGIGPIRSDDGGATWITESTAISSPSLAGEAFFSLAVDLGNRENVVGGTSAGLYQRTLRTDGTPEWVRRRPGVHSSVVVASSGNTRRFFAAEWGRGVFHSTNGTDWTETGTAFPTNNVGRIALAVQPNNPNVLYAMIANEDNEGLHGVYRLDGVGGTWEKIANPPSVLPLNQGHSQGSYDLAIAVDPLDVNLLYMGGNYAESPTPNDPTWPWPGAIWRAKAQASGNGWKFVNQASIGTHAHADIHVLVHTPGDPTELWCGCDGGVFLNRDPNGTGEFAGLNSGLSCLCTNFMAQHPTNPGILFTGLQDNGTARTGGGPQWTRVNSGDGGYCLIDWANPNHVLVFANGYVGRSTTGGTTEDAWSTWWNFQGGGMTQPIVGTPYNPGNPADADVVAVARGQQVFVSKDFAASWPANMSLSLPTGSGRVFALTFASPQRLFIGTVRGEVFRADRSTTAWQVTRLDTVVAGALGLSGLITDIAIDWSDASLSSVYISFGGSFGGDRRHVWHFDGTRWEERSGVASGNSLLDVEHNALIVDRAHPTHVYVGADIGVWHSSDGGLNWAPFQNGLPDAPVYDLQIHPTQRLLRAATHGRGLYEIPLD